MELNALKIMEILVDLNWKLNISSTDVNLSA